MNAPGSRWRMLLKLLTTLIVATTIVVLASLAFRNTRIADTPTPGTALPAPQPSSRATTGFGYDAGGDYLWGNRGHNTSY